MFRLRSKVRAYTKQLLIGAGWPSDNGMWHAGLRCEKNSSWSSENKFPSMCVFFLWCQVGITSFVVYFLMEKLRWGTCTSSTLSMLTWSQIISWLAKTTTLSGDLVVKSKSEKKHVFADFVVGFLRGQAVWFRHSHRTEGRQRFPVPQW